MKQFLYLVLSFLLCSCGTSRHVQVAERIQKDTVYLSNIQYDSIYVLQDKYTDRSKDTLLIKETNIEYRYKLFKDTVRIVQRDSIPYEVRITEIKEVRKPPNTFDYLCRYAFFLMCGAILLLGYKAIRKII